MLSRWFAAVGVAPPPDPARVARALRDAYAGGAVRSQTLFGRLITAITQAVGWVLEHTLGALVRSGIGGLVALLAIGALLALAFVLLRRARTGLVPDFTAAGAARAAAIDWRAEAERATAAGDLQAAVRARYHVLLEVLATYGVVDGAPGLTAGECRDAVRRARPALYPQIATATQTFERVAYGEDPAAPEDVELLHDAERNVRAS